MSKQEISELSKKTKENYLLKRMNNYMMDKIDPKKKPSAKKHINKTFKDLYGSPKPAGRAKPYMKNESIYHRLARLVLEDIVSESSFGEKRRKRMMKNIWKKDKSFRSSLSKKADKDFTKKMLSASGKGDLKNEYGTKGKEYADKVKRGYRKTGGSYYFGGK